MMIKKIWLGILALALASVGTLVLSVMALDTHNAIACALGDSQPKVMRNVCKLSLVHLRSVSSDLKELERAGGVDYLLNSNRDADKYELANHYIDAGLQVDLFIPRPGSENQITPLHSGVFSQDAQRIKYLIMKGADKSKRSLPNNETPLELARRLMSEYPKIYPQMHLVIEALI